MSAYAPDINRTVTPLATVGHLRWSDKAVGDVLDYAFDYSRLFKWERVIECVVDVPNNSGLWVLWSGIFEPYVVMALGRGVPGRWTVTITLVASTGRRVVREVDLVIREDAGSLDNVETAFPPPAGAEVQPKELDMPDGRVLTL
ncbi:hypothetical protein GS501_02355 [Saccharibacter sp. 17.LH.SD]|uniref:phage fiber-tail adaptor protein n=1 Tax=Saccharibacter sp. 17.LH.SD TaxID=2689393 RepID=UPI00136DF1A3|nr:hypothetical protein [Saccharibacter sp. 17.LH.SD]MXV43894.1 hypothetical protein [Saccharibacter sp. 17.LH.SD]